MRYSFKNENGAALVIGLIFMAILALLGSTAYVLTTTDMRIGGNYKTSLQAFNTAQAGLEEARARMRENANTAIKITYASPGDALDPNWETYIGTAALAQNLSGYASGDERTDSIQSDLGYAVQIKHLTWEDPPGSGNDVVVYWGDEDGDGTPERNITTGNNIYLATAYGEVNGAKQTLTIEFTKVPPVFPQSALYVESSTNVTSAGAMVDGNDLCGGSINLPGVASTQSSGVDCDTTSCAKGKGKSTSCCNVDGSPEIQYAPATQDIDIQDIVDRYKGYANEELSGGTLSGQDWGTPTDMSTNPDCTENNIVYSKSSLHLSGHSTGCGILLVEGDLKATAGLEWYGLIIVTGCLDGYSGVGGKSSGVAGSILSGGDCIGSGGGKTENLVSGSVQLNYCSEAVNDSSKNLPLKILSWKDDF